MTCLSFSQCSRREDAAGDQYQSDPNLIAPPFPRPVLHSPMMLCPCRGKLKLLVVSLSFIILFTWVYLLVGNSESECR